ncbi:MAG: phosphoenolpyruvate carboxykinase domain-containing protein, partial [Candidatus Acidiferrales bacterium]
GYGHNVRVLKWMLDRIEGRAAAAETPIGFVPTPASLDLEGLTISKESLGELLRVDSGDWTQEAADTSKFLDKFGARLPAEIRAEHKGLTDRLQQFSVATR